MQRECCTDFFQKLSSTAIPLKGRTVPNMDEIVDREMKGLTLEDKLKVPRNFVGLIRRIFPALSALSPENLNSSYCKVTTPRQAPKAEGTCRSTRLESRALKPAAQSRSAKKSDRLITGKGIYNVKTNNISNLTNFLKCLRSLILSEVSKIR